jgi:AraC-like DNA-binding protein
MLYSLAIFISFFLALLVLTKRGRNLADVILGIWLVVIGVHCSLFYLSENDKIYEFPHLLGIAYIFPFLHGPLLYLYSEALTKPQNFEKKRWLLHFVLPCLPIILLFTFYISSGEHKVDVFKNAIDRGFDFQFKLLSILLRASAVIYVVATYKLLIDHKKRILDQFSYQEKISLDWLRFLFYGMGVMWIVIIFIGGEANIFQVASVFIFLIGYFGIKQVGIFTNKQLEASTIEFQSENEKPTSEINEDPILESDQSVEKKKYAKSGLNEAQVEELHEKLISMMEKDKPYLNAELSLAGLANSLAVHSNYLSQVINDKEGVTFYDYINKHRIEEFKRKANSGDSQKYTLLTLAYDSGFNSKSSFNRNFKKVTQLSPSEYLKQMNINLE